MSDILDDLLGGEPEHAVTPGTCAHCHQAAARDCTACGLPACKAHTWTMMGVCVRCARSERMVRFHRDAAPEADNWLEG